jgi:hypothetical protein
LFQGYAESYIVYFERKNKMKKLLKISTLLMAFTFIFVSSINAFALSDKGSETDTDIVNAVSTTKKTVWISPTVEQTTTESLFVDGHREVTTITATYNQNPRLRSGASGGVSCSAEKKIYNRNENKIAVTIKIAANFTWGNGSSKCSSYSIKSTMAYPLNEKKFDKSKGDSNAFSGAYAKVDYKYVNKKSGFDFASGNFKLTCSKTGKTSDNA